MIIQSFESHFESARADKQSCYQHNRAICKTSDDDRESILDYTIGLISSDYQPVIVVSPGIAAAIS